MTSKTQVVYDKQSKAFIISKGYEQEDNLSKSLK